MKQFLLALALVSFFAAALPAADAPKAKPTADAGGKWIDLFDGKSLKGWMILSGFAEYRVEDGCIVGNTREFSGNTFLCTDKSYGDFILEFESKNDPALNSGVQIRSQVYGQATTNTIQKDGKTIKRSFPAGRVYGYQVEMANEASGTSGGVYDEARDGVWLYDVSKDPVAKKAFKDNQWNKYRIECCGDSIKTFVNGVPCTNMTDKRDASGFIGLQVHAIKGADKLEVRWRNIRLQPIEAKK